MKRMRRTNPLGHRVKSLWRHRRKASWGSLIPEQDAWIPEDSDLGHKGRKERGLLLPGASTGV